jgi:hypothetical protein
MHFRLQTNSLDLGYLLILVLRHGKTVAHYFYLLLFFRLFAACFGAALTPDLPDTFVIGFTGSFFNTIFAVVVGLFLAVIIITFRINVVQTVYTVYANK